MRRLTLSVLFATALFASCSSEAKTNDAAPAELRFSVIPDFSKTQLAENAATLATYLEKKLGVKVHYEPSNSYTAAYNALLANKLDFVWLGGKTTVDAIDAGGGHVHVLAARDIDFQFKSYFIGNQKAVESGRLKKMTDLAELKPIAKDLVFTFGDKNSTSGHLMPRYFLTMADLKPDTDFKTPAAYAQGGHSGTLRAVADGTADLGALNYAYYDKAPAEDRAKAPILFTTPEYVDYAWVAHDRLGKETIEKLRTAFTSLDPAKADDAAVLKACSAGKFLAADDAKWESIRKVRDALGKDFFKQ